MRAKLEKVCHLSKTGMDLLDDESELHTQRESAKPEHVDKWKPLTQQTISSISKHKDKSETT